MTHLNFEQILSPFSHHENLVLGLSGGIDSIVLLHLLSCYQKEHKKPNVRAIYVNHNISQHASQWGIFCQEYCDNLNIPLKILSVNAQAKKRQSPEDAARKARYNAFKQHLNKQDCLLLAHHNNDQAETLLLQLLRGSGPKGLAAMPHQRKLHHYILARPLLHISKHSMKEYAHKHHLKWVDDESNLDQNFKRNYLRHTILPQLQQQWQGVYQTLSRVCIIQAEATTILEEVAEQDVSLCQQNKEENSYFFEPYLDLQLLKTLSPARIKNCLQYWLRQLQVPVLTFQLLDSFLNEFALKIPSIKTQIHWQKSFYLRYYQGKIFLSKIDITKTLDTVYWHIEGTHLKNGNLNYDTEVRSDLFSLYLQSESDATKDTRSNDNKNLSQYLLELRFRKGGEHYQRGKDSAHFSIKNWFQEQRVPPWLRKFIPLIYHQEDLIQIGSHRVNSDLKFNDSSFIIKLYWQS